MSQLKRKLLKLVAGCEDVFSFYYDQSPQGLLCIDRPHPRVGLVDKRFSNNFYLDKNSNKEPTDEALQLDLLFNTSSQKRLNNYLQDLNDEGLQKDLLNLTIVVDGNNYETQCKVFYAKKSNAVLIGVLHIDYIKVKQKDESADYFVDIAENSEEGVMVIENDMVRYVSPAYKLIMGYDKGGEIPLGKEDIMEKVHPDFKQFISDLFEEVRKNKPKTKTYTFRVKKRNGEYIWRKDKVIYEYGKAGEIYRAIVFIKDVTKEVESLNELKDKEEVFQKLFNNVQIGLILADQETNILEVNAVAADLIGVSIKDFVQKRANDSNWQLYKENYELLPSENSPIALCAKTSKPIGATKLGFEKYDGSGKEVWIEVTASPILDKEGRVDKVVCTFVDVTAKHNADKKIKAANEELNLMREFIESSTDALQVTDESGQLVYINEVASERLGIKKEEASKFSVFDFEEIFQKDDPWLEDGIWNRHIEDLKKRKQMTIEGMNVNRIDKKPFPVELTIKHTIINNKGYIIANSRDITDRKKAEKEIISQARFPQENPNPILRINAKGNLLYFNDAAKRELKDWQLKLHQPITTELRALTKEVFVGGNSMQTEAMIRGAIYSIAITYVEEQKYANIYLLDVTDKREAEKQLEIEKRRLDDIINGTKMGTWEWQVQTGDVKFNRHWAEMLGYTLEEITPGTVEIWQNLLHPEDVPKAEQALEAHFKKQTDKYEIEFRMKHKDGHWEWILAHGKTIFWDKEGNPLLHAGIHINITERKIAEKELRESRERLELSIEGANVGLWEWYVQTGKTIFNEKWANIVGYTLEELQPIDINTWLNLCHSDDLEISDKLLKAHFKGKTEYYECEARMKHKNGDWVWVLDRGRVMEKDEDGKPVRMSGTRMDITERKKQEEELRLFESIIKNTKDAVLISEVNLDYPLDSKIVFANEAVCKMTGYASDELFGKSPEMLQGPLTNQETLKAIETSSKNWKPFEVEMINYKKSGEPFWISLSVTPLADKDGTYTHWIAIQRDITEQKEQDQKLIEAKEKAEAANVAKSEFLANMSHEIRTPLNSVIGFSELLMQTSLDNTQVEYMQSVNYSAHVLLDLINDILDFSKIEAGKLELNVESTDLHELLYQVIEMVKFKINTSDIELLLDIGQEVPQLIKVDAVRLRQILVNLLSNASKFTEKGEIELSVNLDKKQHKASKVGLTFSVRDTGIGISEAKQKSIFDAFSQEDASTTRKYGGTGLGLSISNKLLSMMGSSLQLESEQGQGSCFYFNVCLESEEQEETTPKIKGISKVLIVDDNKRSLEIMQRLLENIGIEVIGTSNGIEALNALKKDWQNIDAVLIDCEMPFMDGKAVAKQIRELLDLDANKTPIILMNAFVNEEECKKFTKTHQVSRLIHKPLKLSEVVESLQHLKLDEKVEKQNQEAKVDSSQNIIDKTVLIVDDNPINLRLANSMLGKLFNDVNILEADSGAEAIEIVSTKNPDMVLMDIQMPGMSGYEATKAIRKIQKRSKPPIIIALTAGTVKGEKERCLEAGMEDYLSKPITMEKLEEMVKKWIKPQENKRIFIEEIKKPDYLQDFNYRELLSRFSYDDKVVEKMIDMIRKGDLKKQIFKLSDFRKANLDYKMVKDIAHNIKGIALNLCFEKIAESASTLEQMHPNYNSAEADKLIQDLSEQYDDLEKIIFNMEYTDK